MFEVGDIVVCINATDCLEEGRTYVVERSSFASSFIVLEDIKGVWQETRFKKVNEMTTEKQPTIINPKAKTKALPKPIANTFYVRRVGGGSPKVVHTTYGDAMNEANRLAELTPGAEFQVIGVLYSVKKVPVYTTEATEYSV